MLLLLLLFTVVAMTTPARLIFVVGVITLVLLTKSFSFVDERLLLGGT